MHLRQALLPLLIFFTGQSAWSGCCGGGGWGCGGLPAAHNYTRGQFKHISYDTRVSMRQSEKAQTKIIAQYMKLGFQLESKKRWADAEQSYRYVLKVISFRDGPGSIASIPAIEHLATVTRAQKKLDDAISFQKTVVLLKSSQPKPNQSAVLNARLTLADLYLQKHDLPSAADALEDSVDMYKNQPSLPQEKRHMTFSCYANVLRQLHKDSEADAIQQLANADAPKPTSEKLAEVKSEGPLQTINSSLSSAQPASELNQEGNKNN